MDKLYLAGLQTYLMNHYVSLVEIEDCLFYNKLRYSDSCAKYIYKYKVFWDEAFKQYLNNNTRHHYTPKYRIVNLDMPRFFNIGVIDLLFPNDVIYVIHFVLDSFMEVLNRLIITFKNMGNAVQFESIGMNSCIIKQRKKIINR